MTPQEIFDYKLRWKPGYTVALHSDLDVEGKKWCRRNLQAHQWSFTSWTAVYEHTFCFEDKIVAQNFELEFGIYARSIPDQKEKND
jgi:hypothetical protein